MAQLSLYMNDEEMSRLRSEAAREGMSISGLARALLCGHRSSAWPDSFWAAYGAISDSSFERPTQPDASLDAIADFD